MEIQGKIFVVTAVLAVILAGIGLFLIFSERRISKLEKKVKELEENSGQKN